MYESHVTIEGLDEADFIEQCQVLRVKPVIIDEDTGSGVRQMMTARFHRTGNRETALGEMHAIADSFDGVIRRKLEYIVNKNIPEHLYLEFHAKYLVDAPRVEEFCDIVRGCGGNTSRNVLKQPGGDDRYVFATARGKSVWGNMLANLLQFRRVHAIMECVVHDDNSEIDINWSGCKECAIKGLIVPYV